MAEKTTTAAKTDRKTVNAERAPYVPAAKGERAEAIALRWYRSGHLEEGIKALAQEDYRRAVAVANAAGVDAPPAPASSGVRGRKPVSVGAEFRVAVTRLQRDDGRKQTTCRVPLDAFGAALEGKTAVALTLNPDGSFSGRLV